jgi:hypothetical protein
MNEKIFAEGIYWNAPRPNQAAFLVGSIGIQRDRLVAWLQGQGVSEKGYLYLDVTERKNAPGEYLVALNTFRPTAKPQQSAPVAYDFDDSEIPF